MIGAELIYALQREVRKFEASGQLTLLLGCRVTKLLGGAAAADGSRRRIEGVEYEDAAGTVVQLRAPNTVLATGGFANDRTETSLLVKHRPDLLRFPTTNGVWATGDGMKMAAAVGAGLVDMDRVQIHPTGFVDPADPEAPTKVLCGEMMRGVGGLLLTPHGERFVNELETGFDQLAIVLDEAAALEAGRHVELYAHKGLLERVDGAAGLARWLETQLPQRPQQRVAAAPAAANGSAPSAEVWSAPRIETALRDELVRYNASAAADDAGAPTADRFGKRSFRNAPAPSAEGGFYVGRIVPVLHYTMGGVRMDETGALLDEDGMPIPGLHGAGEVTGGVHGNNRLGGNSLLECTVFGSIVGNKLADRP